MPRTRTSPSPGSGIGPSAMSKSVVVGSPVGRRLSSTCRLRFSMARFSFLRGDLELTDRLAHSKRHRYDTTERRHLMEPTLSNPARERLEAGELALGVGIRQSRT